MKTALRHLAVLIATWLLAGLAQAQVNIVMVEKQVTHVQNSASDPTLASGSPYAFRFAVVGGDTSIGGLTPVQITSTATGSGVTGPVILSAGSNYDATDNEWTSNAAVYSSQSGAGSLDEAYANGVYGLKIGATSFNITLGGGTGPYTDGYPAAAPMLTGLSAGDFNGSGQLKIDLSLSSYTFNLNGLPGYTSGGHVGIFIFGVNDPAFVSGSNPSGNVQRESIYFASAGLTDPEVTSLTFNPSASTMVAGNTYILEMEYNLAPNATVNLLGVGELDLGLFTYRTTVSLVAIPEPSTYAAIFGALALAGVMIVRRRRTA
jgi:hypothetical protein